MSPTVVRSRLVVTGIVQGVGFRPHLARLAAELGLAGSCHNDTACVVCEVEGPAGSVADFAQRLVAEAPPLARVESVTSSIAEPSGDQGFRIVASALGEGERTMVPPDAAICDACLAEMRDPTDRRYRHPFITCTHCGPRLTITHDLPYDRPLTTMADFPLCPDCATEYDDPTDRRYHAQPISCHACGPRLSYVAGVERVDGHEEALRWAQATLRAGRILAVKGIGGYHLVCDATSSYAVGRLRARKHRPHQPLAVMVPSLEAARSIVTVPPGAEPVLTGVERPIVLLPRSAGSPVVEEVAPALGEVGVMLAYTPLHHLLLEGMPPLVVTSGNLSGEPLAYRDDDALARLADVADGFLTHDRPIAVPCDDSVVAWGAQGPVPIRRSRGHAPLAVGLGASGGPVVLAAGAEIKNTFALVRDGKAYLSGHLGDVSHLETRQAYAAATDQALRFHRSAPALVVADLHPGYASRAWAADFAGSLGVPLHLVQHHHAHLAALAAEHGRLDDDLVGLVLDGTGYGCDGGIWGGELLRLREGATGFERLGHLRDMPLPSGDAGVRNPVRIAAAWLTRLAPDPASAPDVAESARHDEPTRQEPLSRRADSASDFTQTRRPGVLTELTEAELALFASDREWPVTSSAGRLFDVVSALLGVRGRVTYEAQAAVELEALARTVDGGDGLPEAPVRDGVLDPGPWILALAERRAAGAEPAGLAWAFHDALAAGLTTLALTAAPTTVGLSGGVFANRLLTRQLTGRLQAAGVDVLTHRLVPCGDGGLSLGQAAIGLRRCRKEEG